MRISKYEQGSPLWAGLATPDVRWMLRFYGELFGWTDRPEAAGDGPEYHVQLLGDAPVAAIYPQPRKESRRGVPPYWDVHLATDDVDAAAARVAEAGGTLHAGPEDRGGAGRMARIADPAGAAAVLWQPGSRAGAAVVGEPGAVGWYELQTASPDRAAAFFGALLGIEASPSEAPEPAGYVVLRVNGQPVAGIRRVPSYRAATWLPYFEVEDVDAAITLASPKGGNVLTPARDEAIGRIATVQDPQGAVFGLIRSTSQRPAAM